MTAGKQHLITASALSSLIEVIYLLIIDYVDTGDSRVAARDDAAEIKKVGSRELRRWGDELPALRDALNSALTGRNKTENLALLGEELKGVFPLFREEARGFSSEELELLRAQIQYLRTDSERALTYLKKKASLVKSPYVSSKLAPEIGSQDSSSKGLRKLIVKLVGRDDTRLTPDEIAILRDTKPEELAQYRALVREHNETWQDAVRAYIRKSGHHSLPYEEVLAFLKQHNMQHTLLPGFTGVIDDQMRLYTRDGKVVDGRPSPAVYTSIRMNDHYGGEEGSNYVFLALKPDGTAAPFYTADHKRMQAKQKFAKVAQLSKKIPQIRAKWLASLKKFDPAREQCIAALGLEMLFEFSARVGGKANATDGKPTFGISTLLVKHVFPQPNGDILIKYNGKAGVRTVHKIQKADQNQKWLIKPILLMLQDKDPMDRLLTVDANGRKKIVGAATINRYFAAFGAGDVTVHKLRTYHGTKLFEELMEQFIASGKRPKDERVALAIFNKMAEAVGKKLNHVKSTSVGTKVTGTTAIANYIDPGVMAVFFREFGFRPPKNLEKLLGGL